MTLENVFKRIVRALESAGIPYMLTGSFAGSYHGAPRATQDIDLVVAPDAAQIRALAASLPADEYYLDLDAALSAVHRRSQFNIVDTASGWKIDLIVRGARPFSVAEFERRVAVEFAGMTLYVASLEDVVLSKLEWAKLGESARQVEDVVALLRSRGGDLDRPYLARWVHELGLLQEWKSACLAAGCPPGL